MLYISTMGKDQPVDMITMVKKGKPDDGGLYMPASWKAFTPEEIEAMKYMSITEIGYEVGKKLFGEDVNEESLERIAKKSLTFNVPIQHVHDNIYLMWLDQGPTGAFKDFAARYMARFMEEVITKYLDKEMVIIVATSGDTGAAVASAFYNVSGTKVYVMYPENEISKTQALLMDTIGGNVYTRAVDAKFDDLQRWTQILMEDADLKDIEKNTANSIHLLRLLPQTIYHFYASSRVGENKEEVIKCDASGNFGNMTSDVIAWKFLGNPVNRVLVAVNENDEFPTYLQSGIYKKIEPSKKCYSTAMDVGNPSNMRRLFYIYGGKIDREGNILKYPDLNSMRRELFSRSISNEDTIKRMLETWKKYRIATEPHGAVALELAELYKTITYTTLPILVTETAATWKFPTILEKLNIEVELPEWVKKLKEKTNYTEKLPGNYNVIKEDFYYLFS